MEDGGAQIDFNSDTVDIIGMSFELALEIQDKTALCNLKCSLL